MQKWFEVDITDARIAISYLEPARKFGHAHSRAQTGEYLGIGQSTVTAWKNGTDPVQWIKDPYFRKRVIEYVKWAQRRYISRREKMRELQATTE